MKLGFAETLKTVLSPLRAVDQFAQRALESAKVEPCPHQPSVHDALKKLEHELAQVENLFNKRGS